MRRHLEARRLRRASLGNAAGIHRQDDTLRTEATRQFAEQFWTCDRSGIDTDLVSSGAEQLIDILDATHATADRQRNEDLTCGATHHVEHGATAILGSRDIQEGQLISALLAIAASQLHRIAGITEILKVDPLDDPPIVDIQARNHAYCQRHSF